MKTHLALKKSKDLLENQNQFLKEEVCRQTKDASLLQEASIMALAALAETRGDEPGGHLQRTKRYIRELAQYMNHMEKYKEILTPERRFLCLPD